MNAGRDYIKNVRQRPFGLEKAWIPFLPALAGISSTAGAAITVAPTVPTLGSATVMSTANAEMQAVLEAHAAPGPKQIKPPAPIEARKQSAPASAVMEVLERQWYSFRGLRALIGTSLLEQDHCH